jgi:hypothetical protein
MPATDRPCTCECHRENTDGNPTGCFKCGPNHRMQPQSEPATMSKGMSGYVRANPPEPIRGGERVKGEMRQNSLDCAEFYIQWCKREGFTLDQGKQYNISFAKAYAALFRDQLAERDAETARQKVLLNAKLTVSESRQQRLRDIISAVADDLEVEVAEMREDLNLSQTKST